jgi:hypothetical protein
MSTLGLKCFLIEPAEKLIMMLSRPKKTHNEIKNKNTLYSKWIQHCIELYNGRTEFLLLANTKINGYNTIELETLHRSYKENYILMNDGFESINSKTNRKNNNEKTFFSNQFEEITTVENDKYSIEQEFIIFRLIVFLMQYLHVFEDKSINVNLWNYCLKSNSTNSRCLIIGFFTLICQYVMTIILLYDLSKDFQPSNEIPIILITIFSTITSLLYSYDTFTSFWHSIPLYNFLIQLYKDYPELELSKKEKDLLYYKDRKINMSLTTIRYNLCADFLSNGILPLVIPFINIFIILNSESVVDAILNSIAIFFIIQIDEELYTVTDYESDIKSINFMRWVIGNIYCKHFPEYTKIFKHESNTWHDKTVRISKKYKKNCKHNNKIDPKIDPNNIAINVN